LRVDVRLVLWFIKLFVAKVLVVIAMKKEKGSTGEQMGILILKQPQGGM